MSVPGGGGEGGKGGGAHLSQACAMRNGRRERSVGWGRGVMRPLEGRLPARAAEVPSYVVPAAELQGPHWLHMPCPATKAGGGEWRRGEHEQAELAVPVSSFRCIGRGEGDGGLGGLARVPLLSDSARWLGVMGSVLVTHALTTWCAPQVRGRRRWRSRRRRRLPS
jgi:hypothetical protein